MTSQALIPRRDLDELEQRVINAALRTMDATPKLKYGGRDVTLETIRAVLRRPAVQYAMRAAIRRRLNTELVPMALHFLGDVVRNETVPTRERISAAKSLIDQADLKRDAHGDDGDKPLADMGPDELKAFLEAARLEMRTRAGEPDPAEDPEPAPPRNPTLSLRSQARKGQKSKRAAAIGPRPRNIFD